MKHTYRVIIAALMGINGLLPTFAGEPGKDNQITPNGNDTVYVSAVGNDIKGDGTSASPFYSLNRAIEGKLLPDSPSDTLFVLVAPGDYYMQEPFSIQSPSSRPVVIQSQEKEKPRLMGGIRVSGWQKCGNGLYRAYIPEVVKYGFDFEQFYVNDRRAILARTPNTDWFYVKDSQEQAFVKGIRAADYAVQRIDFQPSDWTTLKGLSSKDLKHLKFRFYHKWDITRKCPTYIEPDSARIYTEGKGMKPWNPIQQDSRYFMYDYQAALDIPGEWFLDRESGYIYYMPLEGEDMETAFCIAPALHQWVIINGKPAEPVKNIRLEGLSFQYAAYKIPVEGEEPMQAAASTEAAMQFDFSENVTLENCEILHTGAYGIWLGQECHQNKISHCYIADLGAGGIKIGEPYFRTSGRKVTSGNVIDNNIITHAGHEQPCGVGIAMFHTSDNKVTHNEISDILYSGISIGWVWGYNQSSAVWTSTMNDKGEEKDLQMELNSPSVRNIVKYNHIHHIGWGELSDMGAVYTLGESEGTQICYNVIHDVLSYDYGGWGLYTDEGSTGVEMAHNLVYRCKSGGFHQHYGKNNRIENNIFAFGHYYQVQYTRVESHLSFHFRHNIILQEHGETLSGPWDKGKIDMDYNLYWRTDCAAPTIKGHTFKEWKKLKEPHSIVADPLFKDAQKDDYTFTSLKNVRKIGFKPYDYTKAGVYGSSEWRKKAVLSPQRQEAFRKAALVKVKK